MMRKDGGRAESVTHIRVVRVSSTSSTIRIRRPRSPPCLKVLPSWYGQLVCILGASRPLGDDKDTRRRADGLYLLLKSQAIVCGRPPYRQLPQSGIYQPRSKYELLPAWQVDTSAHDTMSMSRCDLPRPWIRTMSGRQPG